MSSLFIALLSYENISALKSSQFTVLTHVCKKIHSDATTTWELLNQSYSMYAYPWGCVIKVKEATGGYSKVCNVERHLLVAFSQLHMEVDRNLSIYHRLQLASITAHTYIETHQKCYTHWSPQDHHYEYMKLKHFQQNDTIKLFKLAFSPCRCETYVHTFNVKAWGWGSFSWISQKISCCMSFQIINICTFIAGMVANFLQGNFGWIDLAQIVNTSHTWSTQPADPKITYFAFSTFVSLFVRPHLSCVQYNYIKYVVAMRPYLVNFDNLDSCFV